MPFAYSSIQERCARTEAVTAEWRHEILELLHRRFGMRASFTHGCGHNQDDTAVVLGWTSTLGSGGAQRVDKVVPGLIIGAGIAAAAVLLLLVVATGHIDRS
jgi:hypothetical protein